MKKFLVLSVSLVATMSLVACGGGSTASIGKSSAAAGAVAPVLADALGGAGGTLASVLANAVNVSSVKVNTSTPVTIEAMTFNCPTSGTATTSGSGTVDAADDGSSATYAIDADTVFAACKGSETRCTPALDWTLDGTIKSVTNGSITVGQTTADLNLTITQTGTINVTGFATFACEIATTLTLTYTDLTGLEKSTTAETVDNLLSHMTGTICGQDVAAIKTLYDGTDAEYCAGVNDIAASNT